MNNLTDALWIEYRKISRSKVPLITALGYMIMPFACSFLMFVYKNPEIARNMGLVSAKANLIGGTADWPSYLSLLAQGTGIGGIILFSFMFSWVFGREFADGTLKDMLAVPVTRGEILSAKLIVVSAWSLLVSAVVFAICLILGAVMGLPQGSADILMSGSLKYALVVVLVILDIFPIAFFASAGRGYLLPMGIAVLMLISANLVAVAGWGEYFPWSVPALFAEVAGKGSSLSALSFWIVLLTGAAGAASTYLWWKFADQNR